MIDFIYGKDRFFQLDLYHFNPYFCINYEFKTKQNGITRQKRNELYA